MYTGSTEPLTSCVRCDTAFPRDARFCPNCGLSIEASLPRVGKAPVDPLIDQVIAERYRLLSVLGTGGMGVVYKVEHTQIGKLMAMKVLSGRLARNENLRKRFQREAQTASKLSHPNTVQIFDFGESDQLAYLVMEYLPGRDLASVIADGPIGFSRVAAIAAQVAASVGEAHDAGIVHRDIKPENVMILDAGEEREFVKVLDFGIAKVRGAEERLTGMGELVGTPFYMAPEQIRGEGVDHRTDLYALGGLMYKCLTGEPPFNGDNPQMLVQAHLNDPPLPLRKRAPKLGIPEEAERIVGKLLEKDPARRHQSMYALRDDLTRYLRSQGVASGLFDVESRRHPPSGELFATRDDIDIYERKTRTGGFLFKALALVLLVALGVAAFVLRGQLFASEPKDQESEPNDDPNSADTLWPGIALKGKIGPGNKANESDPDVYRIDVQGPMVARLSLSGVPNVNLALDVVAKGSSQPLLSVNSAGVGEPETIPNLTLTGSTYFVRVREVLTPSQPPPANRSEAYTLELALTPEVPGFEREINDAVELATPITPGSALRGYVGWNKDKDVYCAPPGQAAQTVALGGLPEVDLVLSYLDRISEAGQRVDHHGPGEGEQLELPASKSDRSSCFTVSAKEHKEGRKFDAKQSYELELSR
ncbi:MAG TPA: serine/threonine-protein kinase [Polyangiales bacterium]|nr:serine/threonine-protein kinase [Polyangiales bacterium]